MRLSTRLPIARSFSFVALLAVALVACKGAPTPSALPGLAAASQSDEPSVKIKPNLLRLHPFKTGKQLGVSGGQPVYALFMAPKVSLASAQPANAATPDVWVYGAPVVGGKAGTLSQIAIKSSATSEQHLYIDARGRLFELTDKASSTLMLVKYKGSEVLTTVCKAGQPVGEIIQTTTNGVITTKVRHGKRGLTCSRVTGAVAPPHQSPGADTSTAPSVGNAQFYSCIATTTLSLSTYVVDYGGALVPQLNGIASIHAALQSRFGYACSNKSSISLTPPAPPPACPGSACAYQAPPVPLTAAAAACPTGSSTSMTFNAPMQTCSVNVAYNVSSSSKFTVMTSNASIVTVSPSSGTVSGSGTLKLVFTSGSQGGNAIVGFTAGSQEATYLVDNAWTTSTNTGIASVSITLPSATLALGQQMTFGVTAKSADGQTIVGTYDNPILLSTKYQNLTISPTSVPDSAAATQITASWKFGFAGPSADTITATVDGQTATVNVAPGTGLAYYNVGNNAATDTGMFQITYGPDGNVYYGALGPTTCTPAGFCTATNGAVGQFNPTTQAWTEVPLNAGPYGMLFTGDGALWIAGGQSHNLFRFPPSSFTLSALQTIPVPSPVPGATYFPRQLTTDGTNVWFGDAKGGRIIKNPIAGPYDGSALTAYGLPGGPPGTIQYGAWADGVQYGNDGYLYIVDRNNGLVDQVNPANGATTMQIITPQETAYGLTYYGYPGPNFMTQDAAGTLYFTLEGYTTATGAVGGVDTLVPGANPINALALPSAPSGAEGYGISANGSNLYYLDYYGGLGYVNTTTGAARLYRFRTINGAFNLSPNEAVTLPDGTAWFTCSTNTGPPLCLGHTVYLGGWTIVPGPSFTILGFGAANSQPVGIMEAPAQNSAPFTATSSDTSVCQLSSVVDHNFVITGLVQGTCTVSVTDATSHSAQIQVSVQPTPSPTPAPAARFGLRKRETAGRPRAY